MVDESHVSGSYLTGAMLQNMANPVSTVRHNVFRGLGEELATWDELRTSFLDSFHPIGYAEWVRDELSNVQLLPHETLQMYTNKVEWLISK